MVIVHLAAHAVSQHANPWPGVVRDAIVALVLIAFFYFVLRD